VDLPGRHRAPLRRDDRQPSAREGCAAADARETDRRHAGGDETGEGLAIAPDNATRYAPYVQMLERVDAKQLAGIYLRFYPWFQQAYEELGYPKAYFNDRLVAVIDHLLAAPEPGGPILLTQPKVLYQYLDPQLEALSAGQKTLVRMGPDNARRVKAKLRELRREITAQAKK
jgi:hypothetical protein